MKRHKLQRLALDEFKRAIRYYTRARNKALADDFITEFERIRDLIRNHPGIGHTAGPSGVQQFGLDRLKDFPS